MKTLRILFLVSVFSLVANLYSPAAPLYLTATGLADLNGQPLDVTYDSSSGSFQANGFLAADVTGSGVSVGDSYPGFYGYYTLSATINNAGVVAPGGTLTVQGDIGSGLETLLSGNLVSGPSGTAWGYDNGGDPNQFSFYFTVASGGDPVVMSDFGGLGARGGINLFAQFGLTEGDNPFSGTWGGSFDNNAGSPYNGSGFADTFPVPEPSSILLVSAGVLCLVARRRFNVSRK